MSGDPSTRFSGVPSLRSDRRHDAGDLIRRLREMVAVDPDAIAVQEIDPEGRVAARVTRASLLESAEHRAGRLRSELGPDACVIAAMPSGIGLASWIIACLEARVRLVLVHASTSDGELARIMERLTVHGMISDRCGHPEGRMTLLRTPKSGEPGRNPGIILQSSGTTGHPKLAIREAAAMAADAEHVRTGLLLTGDDVMLCIPPITHSYGLDLLVGSISSGCRLDLMPVFSETIISHLTTETTVLPSVPVILQSLSRAAESRRASRLRLVVSAGSALPAGVRRDFTRTWGLEVGQLYGATELGTVAVHRPGDHSFDPEAIGAPISGVSMRIVDPENVSRALPDGVEGHLAVRADSMMSGYVDGEAPMVDGHFLTGDLAVRSAQGTVRISGRLKFIIDVGAFKVNPLEVEDVIASHPGIRECAVRALPLSETMTRLEALVVYSDSDRPVDSSALRAWARNRLSPVKVPRLFTPVSHLPRSPTGKLLRSSLSRDVIA